MTENLPQLLAKADRGIEAVAVPDEIKQAARENLSEWIQTEKFAGLVSPSDYGAISG